MNHRTSHPSTPLSSPAAPQRRTRHEEGDTQATRRGTGATGSSPPGLVSGSRAPGVGGIGRPRREGASLPPEESWASDDAAAEDDGPGLGEDGDVLAGVLGIDDDVGRRTLGHARGPEDPARPPARGGDDVVDGHAGADHLGELRGQGAVRDGAAGVGAHEQRHAGLVEGPDLGVAALVHGTHPRGVRRELRTRLLGEVGEVAHLEQRGGHRDLPAGGLGDVVGRHPGAVLDAVDAGVEEVVHGLAGEGVRGDPRAVLVGGGDARGEDVGRPQRAQVPRGAVDPVRDDLHPAVAEPGLLGHGLGQPADVVELTPEVAQVALGPGEVVPGADEARQVPALLHPAVVLRGAGVAHEQHAGVAVRPGLRLGLRLAHRTLGTETDVAVDVDEPGQHPALDLPGRLGGHLEGEAPVDHPALVQLGAVADDDRPGEVQRLGHGYRRYFCSSSRSGTDSGSCVPPPRPKADPLGAAGRSAARRAASASCLARLAGLPDLPFFPRLGGGAMRPLDFFPPPGSPPGPKPPAGILPPERAIWRIIVRAWSKRSMSWLTSVTVVPEPRAMRERREPLMIRGLLRSSGVIERTMASMRSTSRSSKFSSASRIWPAPGSIPSTFFIEPIFFSCCIWSRKSCSVKSSPPATFAAIRSASSWSKARSACSMRVRTSPMSRMREAIRSAWKRSKSVSFSPVEAKSTGRPVTLATDSAAPPRASPSSLVRTTPVKSTPSRKACAVATASWPIIASRTKRVSSGWTASLIAAACAIISSSTPRRPAVSTMTTE